MHLTLCRFISVDASLSIDAQDHILCSEQRSLVQPLCDRELDETKAAASGPDWTALDRTQEKRISQPSRLDWTASHPRGKKGSAGDQKFTLRPSKVFFFQSPSPNKAPKERAYLA